MRFLYANILWLLELQVVLKNSTNSFLFKKDLRLSTPKNPHEPYALET